jgi:hypothetical protein
MDRSIVYPGSIPLDTDLLNTNRNAMVALGALIQMVLGQSSVIDGLSVGPTAPASMSITVGPGSITQLMTVDASAYGSLAADVADQMMKMGVNLAGTTLALGAPAVSGQSVAWLIEAGFLETDTNNVVLPYYNAANPSVAFLGPSNTGVAQPTLRAQRVQIQARQGVPAATGSQLPPAADAGWYGLAVVNVAYGQTQVVAGNIVGLNTAPTLQYKLPALRPGFSQQSVFTASGTFGVPAGVTKVKVRAIGGGGGGGGNTTQGGGGGGGGGGYAEGVVAVTPGQAIAVTVGGGGAGGVNNGGSAAANSGAAGGASSFGTALLAAGGNGGLGSLSGGQGDSGAGGSGAGGAINMTGGSGNAGSAAAASGFGGMGGAAASGGGGGAASSGLPRAGSFPGGGGGGGGGNTAGAAGAGGLLIVEW